MAKKKQKSRSGADFGQCEYRVYVEHASKFTSEFIEPRRRERYVHFLIEDRIKARRGLSRLEDDLLPSMCRELLGSESQHSGLEAQFGQTLGVFISGGRVDMLTASDAAQVTSSEVLDAILSFEPGHLCLVFSHEGGVWLCERD